MKRALECVGVAAWLAVVPITTTAAVLIVLVLLFTPGPRALGWTAASRLREWRGLL